MTEAVEQVEHLDRLLQKIVREEMRKLQQLETHTNLLNLYYHYLTFYGKENVNHHNKPYKK